MTTRHPRHTLRRPLWCMVAAVLLVLRLLQPGPAQAQPPGVAGLSGFVICHAGGDAAPDAPVRPGDVCQACFLCHLAAEPVLDRVGPPLAGPHRPCLGSPDLQPLPRGIAGRRHDAARARGPPARA